MQTNPLSDPSPTRPYNLIQLPSPDNSPQFPQETSPEEASKQRWKVLFLICSTTFGAYFVQSLLLRANVVREKVFDINGRDFARYVKWITGYLYLIPLVAGLMIYRFGINKTFRCFMLPVILGSLLTVLSFMVERSDVYLYGDSMIKGSTLGLWVAQIYMIIKWFKGKELSFAIGVLGFFKGLNFFLGTLMNSSVERIGLLPLLSFGVVVCVLAGVAAIFMGKIDMTVRQEDGGALVEEEEAKLNKPITIALAIIIICFKLGERERWAYLGFLFTRSQTFYKAFMKVELFAIFAPIILFPLFGSFVDRKEGRTAGVFSSFLLFVIGNMLFSRIIEPVESDSSLILLVACLLFQIGSYLFEVSFWGVLGSVTPKKFLGVILGVAYSLTYFGPQFLVLLMPDPESGGVFAIGFALVVGIVSMFYTWVSLKKKEDFRRGDNQPQIIMPAEAN